MQIQENPKALADHFLSICHMFKLGCLQTEQPHPHTIGLS
jgi:N-acetylmuramic acid 6-phosphate etherase